MRTTICLFLEVLYCNCQFYIATGSKTTSLYFASLRQLFQVPTRNSCCYSKPDLSECTTWVAKYFSQLFQVWCSYSECLLRIAVALPGWAWVNAPLGLLQLTLNGTVLYNMIIFSFFLENKIKVNVNVAL